jgi:hypothetical protein
MYILFLPLPPPEGDILNVKNPQQNVEGFYYLCFKEMLKQVQHD